MYLLVLLILGSNNSVPDTLAATIPNYATLELCQGAGKAFETKEDGEADQYAYYRCVPMPKPLPPQ